MRRCDMGRPGVGQPRMTLEAEDGRDEPPDAAEHGRDDACDDGGRDVIRIAGPPRDGRESWRGGTATARSRTPPPQRWAKMLSEVDAPPRSDPSDSAAASNACRWIARRSASGEMISAGRPAA
mmetsp:Transcript_16310/g.41924  ORF Transcript_16310/g.41924 Transcript_16310/m.41924 type:complete len:123 (-) Transcript_16310:16-384(-)